MCARSTSRIGMLVAALLSGVLLVGTPQAVIARPAREQSLRERLGGSRTERGRVSLKIDKAKFLLTVLYRGRHVKSYPVVLGGDPADNKLCEGDGRTPEDEFTVTEIRSLHKWSKFLLLSYPTAASRRRFLAARKAGKIPPDATIGAAIGIHGVPVGHDNAIDARQNWTAGCISLRTRDIDEIASVCRRGTRVNILH